MPIKILANDGIDEDIILLFEEAGYIVDTDKISQTDLPNHIGDYDVIIIRSSTKMTKDIIEKASKLKIIARAGVGLDNVDVDYATQKNIKVINTPRGSSRSVAELTMAHIYALARSIHSSNYEMPRLGVTEFKKLKKKYTLKSFELDDKTLGIIGVGNIGNAVAQLALGAGMDLRLTDKDAISITVDFNLRNSDNNLKLSIEIPTVDKETLLSESDIITIHAPWSGGEPIIGAKEIKLMKKGAYIINTSRGGAVCEDALLAGLESGQIAGAALDVFIGEPQPRKELLEHPLISNTPHIGGSTGEAQKRIGLEIADKVLDFFGDN